MIGRSCAPWALGCAAMGVLAAFAAGQSPSPQETRFPLTQEDDREQATFDKLAREIEISLREAPLSRAIEILGDSTDVRIEIDRKALADVGIGTDTPVSFGRVRMAAGAGLRHLLRDLDAAYVVRGDLVLVTTPEEANEQRVTRVYPVADLLYGLVPRSGAAADHDSLIDLITSTVDPTAWDVVGGPGSCTGYEESIVVAQTLECHEEIERLLAALRASRGLHEPWQGGMLGLAERRVPSFVWRTDGEQRIYTALAQAARADFEELPLSAVAAELARQHRIPVLLDQRALSDVGIAADAPVTARLEGELKSELARTLKELDLTFVVRDDALLITTPEEQNARLTIKAYPVFDLVGERPIAPRNAPLPAWLAWQVEPADADSLIDLVTSAVAPSTWDDVGGPGAIDYFAAAGCLVIAQTDETHEEIERLLLRVRATSRALPKLDPARLARIAKEPVACIHRLAAGGTEKSSPAAMARLVRKHVEPEAWRRPGQHIETAGRAIIVRAPPSVQDAVAAFLAEIGASDVPQWGF